MSVGMKQWIRSAAFGLATLSYAVVGLGSNAVLTGEWNDAVAAEVKELRGDGLRGLSVRSAPKDRIPGEFSTLAGEKLDLSAFEGKVVLLNFWATWCAPCREEMPAINALQKELSGDDFTVVALATGRNNPAAIEAFFEDHGIDSLEVYLDPRSNIGRRAGALGLPVTLILDRQGREVAKLIGGADWHSDSAKAIITRIIEATKSEAAEG